MRIIPTNTALLISPLQITFEKTDHLQPPASSGDQEYMLLQHVNLPEIHKSGQVVSYFISFPGCKASFNRAIKLKPPKVMYPCLAIHHLSRGAGGCLSGYNNTVVSACSNEKMSLKRYDLAFEEKRDETAY